MPIYLIMICYIIFEKLFAREQHGYNFLSYWFKFYKKKN